MKYKANIPYGGQEKRRDFQPLEVTYLQIQYALLT